MLVCLERKREGEGEVRTYERVKAEDKIRRDTMNRKESEGEREMMIAKPN